MGNKLINFSLYLSVFFAFVILSAAPKAARASILDPSFNAGVTKADAQVYVTKPLSDGRILVGGFFSTVNDLSRQNLVRLNADGSTDLTFNSGNAGPNNPVNDIVQQADGKFIIGGSFTTYNGVSRIGIARINADGSLDSAFNPILTGSSKIIDAIAIQSDGKILVAGGITKSVIRLNADGSTDLSFTSPFNFSGLIQKIALQADGKILVGGAGNLTRLNANGSIDNAFSQSEPLGDIYDIVILGDGKILIGGNVSSNLAAPRISIKRLKSDGSTDETFMPGDALEYNRTSSLAVQPDGKILTAGIFSDNGISTLAVLRLNANGSADASFTVPTANDQTYHVALQADGKILVGGGFSLINGQSKAGLARLNTNGTIDNSFNAAFYGKSIVYELKQQADGKILAGGSFNFANSTARSDIARFNSDGTLDNSFNTGTGLIPDFLSCCKQLYDVEIQPDGKIILGGIFNGFNGSVRRGVVRLNSGGAVDPTFNSAINGGTLFVQDALALPDGKLMVSSFGTDASTGFGWFGLNRLNADGNYDEFFANVEGTVYRIARQPDGKLLIGGSLIGGNADTYKFIKRLDADGSTDTTFNIGTDFNSAILDIVVQPDGKIMVGGAFTSYNGTPINRIARLNANGSLDTSFNPGIGADRTVRRIALLPNGKIAVGGDFDTFNGAAQKRLVILNSDGSPDPVFVSGFDANPANTVRSLLVQNDGKLVVGGYFQTYDGVARNSIVRLRTAQTKAAPFDFDGDAKSDLSIFRSSNGEWWYQRSSNNQVVAAQFGSGTDKIVPADFSGDGKTDIAFWRPASGEWFILRSENNSFYSIPFGASGDIPAPSDFDADGKADPAVFRPSTGTWFINKSAGGTDIINFGQAGDVPAVGDYDGDGKADIAIFRPSSGEWWLNRSSAGVVAVTFGSSTDKPVAGDFTGDGKTDIAFWRPSNGFWFILRSEDSSFYSVPFGASGDVPAAGDFDGDGRADTAVFRPSGSTWYINRSTAGLLIQQFGLGTDTPVPAAFLP